MDSLKTSEIPEQLQSIPSFPKFPLVLLFTCKNSRTFDPKTRKMVSYPDSWQNSKNIFPNSCRMSPASISAGWIQTEIKLVNKICFLISTLIKEGVGVGWGHIFTYWELYLQQPPDHMFWHLHIWFSPGTDLRYQAEPPSWKKTKWSHLSRATANVTAQVNSQHRLLTHVLLLPAFYLLLIRERNWKKWNVWFSHFLLIHFLLALNCLKILMRLWLDVFS